MLRVLSSSRLRFVSAGRLWLLSHRFCSSPSSSTSSISVPSHQHIVRLILDQKTASGALETFQWASKLSGFNHSRSTYQALIHKLCCFRRFETVYQLLDEMPAIIGLPPDDAIFITVVRGLGRARMIKEVIKVADLSSKFETKPSLKVLNTILDVLVKKDIDLARGFFRRKMMASGIRGDDYTYGILMKGLCLTNRIGDGFKLLQIMKTRGVPPNAVIYNTLIHALCKNGKVGRARSVMSEMKEPNDVTFNILISAYCNEQKLIQSLVLLENCFTMGLVPDVVTVSKVMEVLCSEGRVSEALEVLERVESKGGKIDVVACNSLINGYCALGKVRVAKRFLKEMERKGCLPNADTYNLLIAGFCESGMLDSALDAFNDMKTDGIRWNFTTFNTLIRGLSAGGRVEDGLKILEMMEDNERIHRCRIDPYNSILYGFYRENRLAEAMEFLSKMETLFPRAVDRSFKILAFCEKRSMEDAKMVYDQMIREGGIPNVLVYNCLIHLQSQEGRIQEGLELLNEMVSGGYLPQASTFNALIHGFCRPGKTMSGLKFMEDMAARGCIPNKTSYAHLIDGFCEKGDFQNAWQTILKMVENGVVPDSSTWSSLLLCLGHETCWKREETPVYVDNLMQQIIEAEA